MSIFLSIILAAAAPSPQSRAGLTVNVRGVGNMTCVTAFLPENQAITESWIAGYWAAWDMSQINAADPIASDSDLNGLVGEVEKVCRDQPSSSLLFATMNARNAVKERDEKMRR